MSKVDGVSVIIPCYNSEKTIDKCISSIFSNVFCKEIIVVDDGSTDCSKDIIRNLELSDSRIKYYYKKNGGVSSARNLGLSKSTCAFILFLDSDDFISEKSIDRAYEFSFNNDIDICNFRMEEINFIRSSDLKFKSLDKKIFEKEKLSDAFLYSNMYSSCAKLIKSDLINLNKVRFLDNLTYSEDYIFSLNLFKYAKRVGFCLESIYYVENINPNSISKSYIRNMEESIFEKRKALMELFSLFPEYEKKYFNSNMGVEHFWFISFCENLFKNNTPYNFLEAYKLIKLKYKEFKKCSEYNRVDSYVIPKSKIDKLYYFLLHSNLPLLIAVVLKIKSNLIKKSVKKKKRLL